MMMNLPQAYHGMVEVVVNCPATALLSHPTQYLSSWLMVQVAWSKQVYPWYMVMNLPQAYQGMVKVLVDYLAPALPSHPIQYLSSRQVVQVDRSKQI